MLQLECSDLILNHACINHQRAGSSDGRTFTVDPRTVLAHLAGVWHCLRGLPGTADQQRGHSLLVFSQR
jgi:hypothetical protein